MTKHKHHISEDMDRRIERAMSRTWNAIAYDCHTLESWTDTPANIAEMVVDADRIRTFGGDDEAATAFYDYLHAHDHEGWKWARKWANRYCNR